MEKTILEAKIMSCLCHRHICSVYAYCQVTSDLLYIVLALAEGGSLRSYMSKNVLSFAQKLKYARQVTLAVKYLHTAPKPIIHRDLKTDNLVLDDRGDLLLTDFGLARFQNSKSYSGSGTPQWQPPETMCIAPLWTTKSDIYSLGMVFWELLSNGKTPLDHLQGNVYAIKEYVTAGRRPSLPKSQNKVKFF